MNQTEPNRTEPKIVGQVLEDVDHIERVDSMTEEQDAIESEMVALCVRGCRFGIRLGSLCSR